ncbi:MAG: hypothetical protein QG608_2412 [Actinomycetota bacterium]|nr:hypothetical protein [Actinomycetota bacterium]
MILPWRTMGSNEHLATFGHADGVVLGNVAVHILSLLVRARWYWAYSTSSRPSVEGSCD